MMSCREVVILFAGFILLASGMPQENDDGQNFLGIPFIQLKNGGVRFNFAGYHAEAGLGGLLDGSRTGGGLHASAGTPWGAHAAAGLGGLLGGDDASTGGGLYARAGLGNGRPEAAAGLGGSLGGNGRSAPLNGGLYAGATTGNHGVGAVVGDPTAGSDAAATGISSSSIPANSRPSGNSGDGNQNGSPDRGHSNIQIIMRSGQKKGIVRQESRGESQSRRDVSESRVQANQRSGSNSDDNSNNEQNRKIELAQEAPSAPPLSSEANEIVQDANHLDRTQLGHKRLGLRKRLRAIFPRKQVYITNADGDSTSVENAHTVSRRQSDNFNIPPQVPRDMATGQRNGDNGFFDDVFNIPHSTLTAVNQLLRNNSG